MKKETIVRSLRIGLFVGMLAWTVCAAPSVSQRVFPQMVAMADETEEITQVSVGTVLKNGDRLKLDQEYHFYTLNSGEVTIPANTEVRVVPYTEAEHALGFQIGDSVYGIQTNSSSSSTSILLDSISIGYISGDTLIFFDNQIYTNYVSNVYVGDGILKGVSGYIPVLDGETVKYVRQVDDAGTIVFSDDSTMPLPEGNYNGWKVVRKENNAFILEPCYFEKEFSISVPEGLIVEGADGNTANLGDSVVLKSKNLYCVLDGTQTKTVSNMTRDADGYYCYTVNRVLNDISAEYRTVVRTKEELLHARIGDYFIPSASFSIDCADGEGNIYCVLVDGCIRTWEKDGTTSTIFAEQNRYRGGEWTRASANGYRGHIQFNEDATIQGTYEAADDTNIPAVDLNTPVNGWVVKQSVYKRGAYSDGNGGMINRYAFSLYGAEYTEPEPEPQFFTGKVLHVGEMVQLEETLRYTDPDGYWVSIPAGTEVTFGENTDSNYFWCRYAFEYNGGVYPISSDSIVTPYFENPTYLDTGTVVISGSPYGDNGFSISQLRQNVVFGKNLESYEYYNGDVLAGVAAGSMFNAEKLFVMNGNQTVSAWGIDENGNLIDANHEIVYASDQNNAWRITAYEVVDGTGMFTVEPYQFSAFLNVSAEEGIEVIGAENGTVPAFGSVTFQSKEPMCVEYDGRFYDIREMTVDADGYYVIEFPTVVKDISARQSTVITSKAGLEFAKAGDIFMPTVDEEITAEDTYLDQFMVGYAMHEYEVIGEDSGTSYDDGHSKSGVTRGYDDILYVYSDGSLEYTDEFYGGIRVVHRYYPATSENHRSNSWIIVSVRESTWNGDQSCVYKIDLEGYDAPYAYHAPVAPTCTEDGTIEYWEDMAGRYFADDAGESLLTSVVDPATGHDYEAEYVWTKSNDTYYCTAKLACSHDDTHVEYVDLDVVQEGNTYTATGQFGELALSDTYVVEIPSYNITVQNGTFKQWEGTTVTVEQDTKVTVCANEPEAGKYFAGWYVNDGAGETLVSKNTTYTFFAEKDVTLVAKYEEEAPVFDANDVTGDVNWTRSVKTAEKDVIQTTESYSVSNGNYAIKRVGYIYAAGEWTNDTLTLEAAGVKNKYMDCNAYNAYYTFNLNLGKAAIATLRPYYIVYNWKTGQEEQIVYGDVVVSTPNR